MTRPGIEPRCPGSLVTLYQPSKIYRNLTLLKTSDRILGIYQSIWLSLCSYLFSLAIMAPILWMNLSYQIMMSFLLLVFIHWIIVDIQFNNAIERICLSLFGRYFMITQLKNSKCLENHRQVNINEKYIRLTFIR